jgi:alanyl-tRNA synthetase
LQAACNLSPCEEVRGYDDLAIDDEEEREKVRIALRVIADHIRAIAFAISDGVMPGNTGRGYVIRRILRRAVRYGYQTLGLNDPFLHRLVDPLAGKMGEQFDGLLEQKDYIKQAIRSEEESFLETLGTGIDFFERVVPYVESLSGKDGKVTDRILGDLQKDSRAMDLLEKAYVDVEDEAEILRSFASVAREEAVPGQVAFLLHDTYGFPIDLTQLMARERGLDVDMEGYEELMERQQRRARAASSFEVDPSTVHAWQPVTEGEDASVFMGYDQESVDDAEVRAVRVVERDDQKQYEVELSHTPFYAEAGGQVGDTGVLRVGDDAVSVLDTQHEGERIAHRVDRLPEALDAPVEAAVDTERRRRIRAHHTATHLMHAALREALGDHVQQKGSLVAPDRLRFDFSHFDAVEEGTLRDLERQVNHAIQRNISKQEERNVPIDEALDRGAMALFDEQYGEEVRVITFDPDYSMELCGGTHVDATGEIGLFRFLSEGSVASGVRRVEAVAGEAALEHVKGQLDELTQARREFRSLQGPLPEAIAQLREERDALQEQVDELRHQQLADQLDTIIAENRTEVDGMTVVTGRIDDASMDDLQELGHQLRDKLGDGAVGVLGSLNEEEDKVSVVATVADDLIEQGMQAGNLVGTLGERLGGGGGGRPQLAAAGGRETEKLDDVLADVPTLVRDIFE